MKKAILSLLFVSSILGASAQSQHEGVSYGFNAGVSLFNVTNNPGGKSLAGFTGGVYASFPIAQQLYIQPEVNYQMQGTKSPNFEEEDFSGNVKFKMNYINVPVLVKYNFVQTNLSLYAGPQVGFLTTGKISAGGTDVSVKDAMNKVDFAGTYGLEYYFPINNTNSITINARYTTGFTKILKSDLVDDQDNGKNKGFAFTVGLRF
ncbi:MULTISPECIES: porin family protein [Chitinophagaceae]